MPAYIHDRISDFLASSDDTIIRTLAAENARARFQLTPEALKAWDVQLVPLRRALRQLSTHSPRASDWHVLLEYPVPMIGRRIDVVLLAHDVIIVLEIKTGSWPTSAKRQVEDYALQLACFHELSAGRTIIPVVVSEARASGPSLPLEYRKLVEPCRQSSFDQLGEMLAEISKQVTPSEDAVDALAWNAAKYKPIPPIIDAAVQLYKNHNVFEIGHACSAREDLDRTTDAIRATVREAEASNCKTICFVTGVPGAGKTLVGLNAVHSAEIKDRGMFLSGNGPLVKVIREALVRSVVAQTDKKKSRRAADIEIETFIKSVHRFAEENYSEQPSAPRQRVIVFDEAQRAWDAEQNRRKKRPPVSEPHMILDIMSKLDGWAVIIALIGGGQEINSGEAGISEWGSALKGFTNWRVAVAPQMLSADFPQPFRLFSSTEGVENQLETHDALYLPVSTRSIRSQHISDWTDAVLAGDRTKAAAIGARLGERVPLTRSLAQARSWLRRRRVGSSRTGLVCSAGAARLRVDGIEADYHFHSRFKWEEWFLDTDFCDKADCDHKYCNNVCASSTLEVAATQFEIQGLELDWVGLCWSDDFTWNRTKWQAHSFNNRIWRRIADDTPKFLYRKNGYRVLLTRARQGMVIYVPRASAGDSSRLASALDQTADFLAACGAVPIENTAPAVAGH